MDKKMILPILIFSILLFVIGISAATGFLIKKTRWQNKTRKIVFVLVTAFCLFPVLMPAGTVSAIPAPNAVLILTSIFSGEIFQVPMWYFETAVFSCISFSITAGLMFLISQMVFFERKQ